MSVISLDNTGVMQTLDGFSFVCWDNNLRVWGLTGVSIDYDIGELPLRSPCVLVDDRGNGTVAIYRTNENEMDLAVGTFDAKAPRLQPWRINDGTASTSKSDRKTRQAQPGPKPASFDELNRRNREAHAWQNVVGQQSQSYRPKTW